MPLATFTAGSGLYASDDATTTVVASATLAAVPEFTAALFAVTFDEPGPVPAEEVAGVTAGICSLYIEQGATLYRTFTCSTDDTAWSWDGWTARAQIRTSNSENTPLLLDLTPYLAADGAVITLNVPATVTETLHLSGRWDLEMAHTDGTVVRLLEGPVVLSKEVTRAS